jgi:glucokinase
VTDELAIGIDLGGTKIHAGVINAAGEILSEVRVPTEADRDAEAILSNMVAAAREVLEAAGTSLDMIDGVGIGAPAPLNAAKGVIISPGNLPSLHGFPIVARLSEALETPTVMDNDANCLGLAEARFGAGAGAEVCCGFTLGTGLGCFLVIHGELYNGPHGAAAEIWCSPHRGEEVEEWTSGRAVARRYEELAGDKADAREIASRGRAGDEAAQEAWRQFGRDLAVPLAYLCNIVDPDVVVFGGSIAKAWDLFQETMVEEALGYVNAVTREVVRIVPGALGDVAGALGAAALVLRPTVAEEPKKLLVTADLHFGLYPTGDMCVHRLAEHVRQSDADVFIIAGDIADADTDYFAACLDLFATFKGVKLMVPGNHDLWTAGVGSQKKYSDVLPSIATDCGFRMLDAGPVRVGLSSTRRRSCRASASGTM